MTLVSGSILMEAGRREMKQGLERLLKSAIRDGVFPGAVLLTAHDGKTVFFEALGFRSLLPRKDIMDRETVFDLASLTKPLATSLAMMKLTGQDEEILDATLPDILGIPVPEDRKAVTPRLLLSHSAGFMDWRPFFRDLERYPEGERKWVLRERLMSVPLAYPTGRDVVYSDLGFMMLEWLIEERAGESLPGYLHRHFYGPLGLGRTFMGPDLRPRGITDDEFAATEDCPWRKRVLRGEVHDENASALGGWSGHAGLFGTAGEVYVIADMIRGHYLGERRDLLRPETVRDFFTRQEIPKGSTWALGWDTPSPEGSSAGRYFSQKSVGHLGFTGTSLWMDLEKDVVVILLTNRVHPTRENGKIREFRPRIHDAVMAGLKLDY